MLRVDLIKKVMSEQKLEEGEGVSSADIWKNIPGRGERLCKGPGAGACLNHRGQCGWSGKGKEMCSGGQQGQTRRASWPH